MTSELFLTCFTCCNIFVHNFVYHYLCCGATSLEMDSVRIIFSLQISASVTSSEYFVNSLCIRYMVQVKANSQLLFSIMLHLMCNCVVSEITIPPPPPQK